MRRLTAIAAILNVITFVADGQMPPALPDSQRARENGVFEL
jgi:hypothetical protein